MTEADILLQTLVTRVLKLRTKRIPVTIAENGMHCKGYWVEGKYIIEISKEDTK
jgi:hypothetical protein